ncbi:MAG: 3-isopropylmalate dehydratase small subunit 1 [Promethearchaeota archaeon]|nr:MAG: 3-isopropylmalate dehydratase small subunit 1 [Candidatus Lokiarchaeota archaeon]
MKKVEGYVYIMGDNISTDDIVPSHCLTLRDSMEMAQYTCEAIEANFTQKAKNLNIIVAGDNFGCGSSREEAVNVFKVLGIKAIIANSFARIYFRNLINQGIPGITYQWDPRDFTEGDQIAIFLEKGIIQNKTNNTEFSFIQLPPFLLAILEKGGILNQLREKI